MPRDKQGDQSRLSRHSPMDLVTPPATPIKQATATTTPTSPASPAALATPTEALTPTTSAMLVTPTTTHITPATQQHMEEAHLLLYFFHNPRENHSTTKLTKKASAVSADVPSQSPRRPTNKSYGGHLGGNVEASRANYETSSSMARIRAKVNAMNYWRSIGSPPELKPEWLTNDHPPVVDKKSKSKAKGNVKKEISEEEYQQALEDSKMKEVLKGKSSSRSRKATPKAVAAAAEKSKASPKAEPKGKGKAKDSLKPEPEGKGTALPKAPPTVSGRVEKMTPAKKRK